RPLRLARPHSRKAALAGWLAAASGRLGRAPAEGQHSEPAELARQPAEPGPLDTELRRRAKNRRAVVWRKQRHREYLLGAGADLDRALGVGVLSQVGPGTGCRAGRRSARPVARRSRPGENPHPTHSGLRLLGTVAPG